MNAMLFSSKRRQKIYETAFKNIADYRIVSCDTSFKSATLKKIENINPHCIIIDYSVGLKDMDLSDIIYLMKKKVPDIRIIYNFGTVRDYDNETFTKTYLILQQQKIYDIIIEDGSVTSILENPLKFGDIQDILAEKRKQEQLLKQNDETESIDRTHKNDNIPVHIDIFSLNDKTFDIHKITEIIDEGEERKEKCVTVALMQLQHHNGCTHTSFEIAKYLIEHGKNPCIIMSDDETYNNMLRFYKYKTEAAVNGFSLNGIHILPFESYQEAKKIYSYIIIDIGLSRIHFEPVYNDADIKVMMCSASEWDMCCLSNWLNYPKFDYTRDINYLFTTSPSRYVQINKTLLKGNCTAYRLDISDNCFSPCVFNKMVYKVILQSVDLTAPNLKKKRKLLKLK
ncbi:MAG: hypothetical protein Q4F95_02100 [Oscillospiraceae bacterium]|nr:hypothetical protein [Oscillospiraceae bacterium]